MVLMCLCACVCVYVCVYVCMCVSVVWFCSVLYPRPASRPDLPGLSLVRGHVCVQSLHGRWSYPLTSALEVQSSDTTLNCSVSYALIFRGSIVWNITTGNYHTVLKCRPRVSIKFIQPTKHENNYFISSPNPT